MSAAQVIFDLGKLAVKGISDAIKRREAEDMVDLYEKTIVEKERIITRLTKKEKDKDEQIHNLLKEKEITANKEG